jgi:hypothetical protein
VTGTRRVGSLLLLLTCVSCDGPAAPWHSEVTATIDYSWLQFTPPWPSRVQILLHIEGPDEAFFTGCPAPPRASLEEFLAGSWVPSAALQADCAVGEVPARVGMAPHGTLGFLVEFTHGGAYRVRVPYGPMGAESLQIVTSPAFTIP